MSRNNDLRKAKRNKKDEFYTSLTDIEKEMKYYRKYFRDKVVFCNCDDPYESNFFKYFALNFNKLGLKKLVCVGYEDSPVAGEQVSLFDGRDVRPAHVLEITEVKDFNGDGRTDLADVEWLLTNDRNTYRELKGNGDFRSGECIEVLKEADVVVTNPPFSLFREYVPQLIEHGKDFIVIGNMNAVTYKEIFPHFMNEEMWFGASIHSGDREFRVPDDYPLEAAGTRVDDEGRKYIRVKGVRWFTNLDHKQRHEGLTLYKEYSAEKYPKYDNYDAIEVGVTKDIPYDYDGVMGVPITFLDKYSPDQFEILGATESEGKGFSNGLWDEKSGVAQPLVNNKRKYKRLFVRRKK